MTVTELLYRWRDLAKDTLKDKVTTTDLFQIKCIGGREFACIDFKEDEHYITFTSIETGKEIKLFKTVIQSINMYKDCYPVSIS